MTKMDEKTIVKKSLELQGLDCSDCALVVEHSLGRLQGVLDVGVNYAQQTLWIEYDSHLVSQRSIEHRIQQLGYGLAPNRLQKWLRANRELLLSAAGGLALLAGWIGRYRLGFPFAFSLSLYLIAYLLNGYHAARHAYHALRQRQFDTDILMVLAALGAAILGDFAEGGLLLFLFSLGHALEERALDRARHAVRALGGLSPKTALVRRDGTDRTVEVERLAIGDIVVLLPGVRIPVDGEILSGNSGVDESPITGESIPVDKQAGHRVFAGSVNGEGVLEVRVTRLARDSTLARVMRIVEQAQAQKSPTHLLTEKFSRIFVPVVLLLDALLILVPPLFGVPFAESFLRAMTLLVAASPCALALGTPAAILAGIAQSARNGILVKGGVHLENLGRLRVIAFDKTGTLTLGKPRVTDVVTRDGHEEEAVLSLAAAVEGRSAHPLAQAVVQEARDRGFSIPEASMVESLTGRGMRAAVQGQNILVGSLKLFEEQGWRVESEVQNRVRVLEAQGKPVMLVGLGQEILGWIAVADAIRPEARPALDALKRLGVNETIMLSGDNPRATAAIAGQLGMGDYRADLMPEEKLLAIQDLMAEHHLVGMVGDGVNDAPALANATVGIAMGSAATDVALETADVALMASDLEKLPLAIGLGRTTRGIIRQNIAISLGVIAVLSAFALFGWAGIGVAIIFHEGSTLLVVLNALRLLGWKAET